MVKPSVIACEPGLYSSPPFTKHWRLCAAWWMQGQRQSMRDPVFDGRICMWRYEGYGFELALRHHQRVDRYLNLHQLARKDTSNEPFYLADVSKTSISIGEENFVLLCRRDNHGTFRVCGLSSWLELTLCSNRYFLSRKWERSSPLF